jgi:hypothetical protein
MELLSPGAATDVPSLVEISGRGEGDELELSFESSDVAQVVIPSDIDQNRVTIINEVTGHLSLSGTIRGRSVEMVGPGIFEFVRA